jgi:uncharacterized protein YbjT (DUF2867 family)
VITGPRALTFAEAAEAISKASGRAVAHHAVPRGAMAEILQQAGMPADYVDMVLRDQDAIRDGQAASVTGTVERVTGRAARGFEQFASGAASAWAIR